MKDPLAVRDFWIAFALGVLIFGCALIIVFTA